MKLLTQIKYPGIKRDFSHKKKIYNDFTIKEINQYQINNFNKVWSYCYSKINFYSDLKKKFNLKDEIKNLGELDNFPRISKKDIIENFDQIKKDVKAKNFAFTGGTSGFVTKFPTGYINSKINYVNTLLCRSWHNIHENDKSIYIWGHSHKFESNIFKKNLNTAKVLLKDIFQKRKRFSAYDLSEEILKEIQKQIFSEKFNTLLSYGSTLSIISNYINSNNMIYDNQINIIYTSDNILNNDLSNIKRVFPKGKIISEYGMAETGIIGYSLTNHREIKILWSDFIIRKFNDEILITDITLKKFPLINYSPDDFLTIDNYNSNFPILKIRDIKGKDRPYFEFKSKSKTYKKSLVILDHIFKKIDNIISVQFFIKENQLFIFCYPNTCDEKFIKKIIDVHFEDKIINISVKFIKKPIKTIAGKFKYILDEKDFSYLC